jgi:hypothetical protein
LSFEAESGFHISGFHILKTGKESTMRRWSALIIAVIFSGVAVSAQQPPSAHDPLFSSDLIAWSFMQEPQPEQNQSHQMPTPDPRPETQPAQNPTPSQPDQPVQPQGSSTAKGSQGQAPTVQTFTGLINKEADSFVLKVSETTSYKLDNQSDVQQYEGKRVRVTGTLDESINLIHVDKIEPLT